MPTLNATNTLPTNLPNTDEELLLNELQSRPAELKRIINHPRTPAEQDIAKCHLDLELEQIRQTLGWQERQHGPERSYSEASMIAERVVSLVLWIDGMQHNVEASAHVDLDDTGVAEH